MTNLTTRPEAVTRIDPVPTSIGRRLLWLGPTGVIVAVGLSVVEWVVVRGPGVEASVPAALLALTMTAPVALARRWPLLAAAMVAVAALVNALVFADLIRCSGAMPAALFIAFAVGARTRETGRGWGWTVLGLLVTIGGLLAQWRGDAALNVDASFLPFGIGLALACWGAGIGWSLIAPRLGAARRTGEIGA
jgi:hypothetical protein